MKWLYIAATVAAIVTGLQYFRAFGHPSRLPRSETGLTVLNFAGTLAELLAFALVIAGLFFFSLDLSITALAVAAAVSVVDDISEVCSLPMDCSAGLRIRHAMHTARARGWPLIGSGRPPLLFS
jgi:hypothetical protein